jgi:hypothetical protein
MVKNVYKVKKTAYIKDNYCIILHGWEKTTLLDLSCKLGTSVKNYETIT